MIQNRFAARSNRAEWTAISFSGHENPKKKCGEKGERTYWPNDFEARSSGVQRRHRRHCGIHRADYFLALNLHFCQCESLITNKLLGCPASSMQLHSSIRNVVVEEFCNRTLLMKGEFAKRAMKERHTLIVVLG